MCKELFHVCFLKYHLRDNLPFQFFQKKCDKKANLEEKKNNFFD